MAEEGEGWGPLVLPELVVAAATACPLGSMLHRGATVVVLNTCNR